MRRRAGLLLPRLPPPLRPPLARRSEVCAPEARASRQGARPHAPQRVPRALLDIPSLRMLIGAGAGAGRGGAGRRGRVDQEQQRHPPIAALLPTLFPAFSLPRTLLSAAWAPTETGFGAAFRRVSAQSRKKSLLTQSYPPTGA